MMWALGNEGWGRTERPCYHFRLFTPGPVHLLYNIIDVTFTVDTYIFFLWAPQNLVQNVSVRTFRFVCNVAPPLKYGPRMLQQGLARSENVYGLTLEVTSIGFL